METLLTKTSSSLATLFTKEKYLRWLWIIIGAVAALTKLSPSRHNNFLIYKGEFWHTIEKLPLYAEYPAEYGEIGRASCRERVSSPL